MRGLRRKPDLVAVDEVARLPVPVPEQEPVVELTPEQAADQARDIRLIQEAVQAQLGRLVRRGRHLESKMLRLPVASNARRRVDAERLVVASLTQYLSQLQVGGPS